jgi:hypothetical protein
MDDMKFRGSRFQLFAFALFAATLVSSRLMIPRYLYQDLLGWVVYIQDVPVPKELLKHARGITGRDTTAEASWQQSAIAKFFRDNDKISDVEGDFRYPGAKSEEEVVRRFLETHYAAFGLMRNPMSQLRYAGKEWIDWQKRTHIDYQHVHDGFKIDVSYITFEVDPKDLSLRRVRSSIRPVTLPINLANLIESRDALRMMKETLSEKLRMPLEFDEAFYKAYWIDPATTPSRVKLTLRVSSKYPDLRWIGIFDGETHELLYLNVLRDRNCHGPAPY